MNNILKEKSRKVKDEVKTLDLKRESLNDKVKMQEKFILDVETRGKEDIEQKKKKKDALADDICVCTMQNEEASDKIFGLKQEQEKLVIGLIRRCRKSSIKSLKSTRKHFSIY